MNVLPITLFALELRRVNTPPFGGELEFKSRICHFESKVYSKTLVISRFAGLRGNGTGSWTGLHSRSL